MSSQPQDLIGRMVAISSPDGTTYRFLVSALLPYAGKTYAVLALEGQADQLLVTHIQTGAQDAPVFTVATEEDIIDTVLEKWTAQRVAQAMQQISEQDDALGATD